MSRISACLLIAVSFAALSSGGPASAADNAVEPGTEFPVREIPNIPPAGEAYYAPDSFHVITGAKDPDALEHEDGVTLGGLEYIFTDTGEEIHRINDRGQDACSFFFPDGKRVAWTSTRDNMDLPVADWSDPENYPTGAEIYVSDLDGGNLVRLTDNTYYEAEVSVSPDGQWVVFGRQVDGNDDLVRIRPDGTDEFQITNTPDLQEGAPFYMPDGETIMFRAWKREDQGKRGQPIQVYTIKHDGTNLQMHTNDNGVNWHPVPAPDGRHYVFTKWIGRCSWATSRAASRCVSPTTRASTASRRSHPTATRFCSGGECRASRARAFM
jgi:dipeptidyl aminopeptidase/acylaminoacyl peptidase